jgi:hypothetical protein
MLGPFHRTILEMTNQAWERVLAKQMNKRKEKKIKKGSASQR